MEDTRIKVLHNLDILSCRVEISKSPIVLLCGGKVKEKERPDDPDPPLASFRHAVTQSPTSYELFRPEEITDWQADGVFNNLVDFEMDLAAICSLVVIILESEGAIAELGAFSQLQDLSKKLIVIKSDSYKDVPSFINLGILRYISEANSTSVKTYPWEINNPTEISTEVIDDVAGDIHKELAAQKESEVFKPNNNSHIIVLICELIRLFIALKESEIFKYLNEQGVTITDRQLRQKLFLLEKFRLIVREEYSDGIFYLYGGNSYHRLRLSFKENFHIDELRIRIGCLEYYNNNETSKHRSRIIKRVVKGGAS